MIETLREIQVAALLGYTEIVDFRRDLKAGVIPKPVSHLGSNKNRPVWLMSDLEQWLGVSKGNRDKQEFLTLVNQVA